MPGSRAVRSALTDWRTFSSARGVGLQDFAKQKAWRPPSVLIETDPPFHSRTRGVLTQILSPAALARLRTVVERKAEALADRLVAKGSFDAVEDLAVAFPLDVIPDAIGLRDEGRENLLPLSDMVFNSFGPDNDIFRSSLVESVRWSAGSCSAACGTNWRRAASGRRCTRPRMPGKSVTTRPPSSCGPS